MQATYNTEQNQSRWRLGWWCVKSISAHLMPQREWGRWKALNVPAISVRAFDWTSLAVIWLAGTSFTHSLALLPNPRQINILCYHYIWYWVPPTSILQTSSLFFHANDLHNELVNLCLFPAMHMGISENINLTFKLTPILPLTLLLLSIQIRLYNYFVLSTPSHSNMSTELRMAKVQGKSIANRNFYCMGTDVIR